MKNSLRTSLLAIGLSLTAGACLLPAQTIDNKHLSVEGYARVNEFLLSRIGDRQFMASHVSGLVGVAAGLTTLPEDGDWYAWAYNYPTFGIGLSHDFAGLMEFQPYTPKGSRTPVEGRMGDIVNLYGWAQFDWIRTRAFHLGPAVELGLAYSDQCYHYKTNPGNKLIGSHVFFDVGFGLHAECLLTQQWALTGGVYFTHHSNAMHTAWNIGTDELSFSAGARYYLSPVRFTPRSAVNPARPEFPKGLHLHVSAAAGVLSFFDEQDSYDTHGHPERKAPARPRVVLSSELIWRYSPVFATGIGVEAGWADNRYWQTDVLEKGKEAAPEDYSPFHAGIYLIQEFHYQQLSAHIIFGKCIFSRTGLEDRFGPVIQKAGVRYQFARAGGLFAGLDLRGSHRGYNLEWALGYRF